MSLKNSILSVLEENKGVVISGETLAEQLMVSRNAIWKAISQLRGEGYQITAATKSGYCLSSQNDILSEQSIQKYIGDVPFPIKIKVYKSLQSTNLTLKQLAFEGAPEGTIVISEEQTNGRGRLGRSFFSPPSTGIYMSLLLRPTIPVDQSLCITTCAAVAVANAIEHVTNKPTSIKWVNDIYCEDKKVCGILTEASFDLEGGKLEYAVLGIGINVVMPTGGFPDEIKNTATALFDTQTATNDQRSRLAAEVITRFFQYYPSLSEKTYLSEYRRRSFLIGHIVTFLLDGVYKEAVVLDVDEDAHLIVRMQDGSVLPLSSGEVSVKLQQ